MLMKEPVFMLVVAFTFAFLAWKAQGGILLLDRETEHHRRW
jgi:hypothetical protein